VPEGQIEICLVSYFPEIPVSANLNNFLTLKDENEKVVVEWQDKNKVQLRERGQMRRQ
jgi:hypothetical protein